MARIEKILKENRKMRLEREPAWTTKDGDVLLVDEMSDSHVRNAFKLLLTRVKEHNAIHSEMHTSHEDIDCLGGPFFWKDEG